MGSLGHDVRQAAMVSSYVRSFLDSHSRRSSTRLSVTLFILLRDALAGAYISNMGRPKTLDQPECVNEVLGRVASITAQSQRQWGKMSAHQMLCHLCDSFCGVIGERAISPAKLPIPRPVLKWLILWAPFKWAHNVKTRPEVEQGIGGTPPDEFERDRSALLAAMERFRSTPDSNRGPHPMMGDLNREEWMRWGYLHMDHHLRQFGA